MTAPTPARTPRRLRRRGRAGIGLALHDLVHDRRTTLVLLFTVAAIVAPVMLLFGLKNGVVATMIEKFLKEPSNLEVTIYGNTDLTRDWFARYGARPDLRFILPNTRTISATIDLVATPERAQTAVEMIPSAAGDPLLPPGLAAPAAPGDLLLTATLAAKLRLAPGDPVTGIIRRGGSGNLQKARLDLRVTGVLPEDRFAGDAVFCPLALLVATEDYRDGLRPTLATTELTDTLAAARTHFANARVYAVDIAGVETLAAAMRADGIEIRTQAEKIRSLKALADTLAFVFQVVALIGTLGGVLALGGALWVNVERKRRSLALLRLYGFGNLTVVLVPLAQSMAIAIGGFILAYGGYLAGAAAFNRVLGQNLAGQGFVCRLGPEHLLAAAGLTLAVALLAASAAGYRASRVDAAECLRET
ncbi:FtsX-like permease family protein [uncultured Thiodictyon sp.]|uniref:ABC transporter permease n=1 Tax=uncultured Thiodictyon sp. TaxID=1846217 RepID=UPI0025D44AC3|nr:FtsX-like permease family protein [uncultured Thiodictyon sp.]